MPSKGYLIWALLPERGEFVCFNSAGTQTSRVSFTDELPYPGALYTRAQFGGNDSLFVMDYTQGAILYRKDGDEQFRRLRPIGPEKDSGVDAMPALQDFAVDAGGNILATTYDSAKPLLLLTPGKSGYDSRKIDIGLPKGSHLASVRYGRGQFVVWLRDTAFVSVLRLK
jgi:hypothetical protein